MSFLCPLEFIVGSTWSHTICSDLPRLLHHPWWCCQKIFPVWVWAPAFGCAKKVFSWFMMKLQFLACALATCLVAAQFQGASSGADVGAVEKEIANQTPQPAVPAEPGNRAVPAPSPTEKENRAAAPPARNRAVPAPSPTEKENRAASPSPTEKENRAPARNRAVPAPSPTEKENRAASPSPTEKENRAARAGKGLLIETEKENRAARTGKGGPGWSWMNGPRQSSLQGELDQHERMLLFSSLAFLILGPSTSYLVPETTCLKWMFGETTISYVKIWNHPIETTTH